MSGVGGGAKPQPSAAAAAAAGMNPVFFLGEGNALSQLVPTEPADLQRLGRSHGLRSLVSKKKRRYVADGFDLDLTYVTPRIIAMGFPSSGLEAAYRNPATDARRFLEARHAGRYRVYNLCSEPNRQYDSQIFHGRVEKFPFEDHNAPPLQMMHGFVQNVNAWLSQHPENVAVVHCKAGKGRTGVMISAALQHCPRWPTAAQVMEYYAGVRTHNSKGVTIQSQRRYVGYYEEIIRNGPVRCVRLLLRAIRILGSTTSPTRVVCRVICKDSAVDWNTQKGKLDLKPSIVGVSTDAENNALTGDVLVILYRVTLRGSLKKMFQAWFHASFVRNGILNLAKADLDGGAKDVKNKMCTKQFGIELEFVVDERWVCPHQHRPDSGVVSSLSAVPARPAIGAGGGATSASPRATPIAATQPYVSPQQQAQRPVQQQVLVTPQPTTTARPLPQPQQQQQPQLQPQQQQQAAPPPAQQQPQPQQQQQQPQPQMQQQSQATPRSAAAVAPVDMGGFTVVPQLYKMIHPFHSSSPGHLSVPMGQLLYVLRTDPTGWSLATHDGQIGWIPERYAQRMDQC